MKKWAFHHTPYQSELSLEHGSIQSFSENIMLVASSESGSQNNVSGESCKEERSSCVRVQKSITSYLKHHKHEVIVEHDRKPLYMERTVMLSLALPNSISKKSRLVQRMEGCALSLDLSQSLAEIGNIMFAMNWHTIVVHRVCLQGLQYCQLWLVAAKVLEETEVMRESKR